MTNQLPNGWINARIIDTIGLNGTLCDGDWVESKDQDERGNIRLIQLADIGDGNFKNKSNRFINEDAFSRLGCTEINIGDILIARLPDPLGRACIFPNIQQRAITVVDVCIIRTGNNSIDSIWLKYWINSPEVRRLIELQASGTTRKRISRTKLESLILPLPPLAEQKQIATLLDNLLAQVDTLKTRLDAIPNILKRFRQSVLVAAVSGKLTEEEDSHFLKKERAMTSLQEISSVIGGLTKNAKRSDFPIKKPYLRVANVYENEFKLDDISEIGVEEKELQRILLKPNDLLIVEGNGSLEHIGRAALWKGEITDCVHQNHLIKIRVNESQQNANFILFYLMSPQGKTEIVSKATSGAGLYTLSISKVSSIQIPVFSLEEQTEIVRRVEELFAFADQIEQRVKVAQQRVNHLTQAILAKAFRGELTAEWREQNLDLISGENSAAALLARIQAEQKLKQVLAKPTRRQT